MLPIDNYSVVLYYGFRKKVLIAFAKKSVFYHPALLITMLLKSIEQPDRGGRAVGVIRRGLLHSHLGSKHRSGRCLRRHL